MTESRINACASKLTLPLRFTHKFAGALGSLLPQAGEGVGMRVIVRGAALTNTLTPSPSPACGRGEQSMAPIGGETSDPTWRTKFDLFSLWGRVGACALIIG